MLPLKAKGHDTPNRVDFLERVAVAEALAQAREISCCDCAVPMPVLALQPRSPKKFLDGILGRTEATHLFFSEPSKGVQISFWAKWAGAALKEEEEAPPPVLW